MMKYALKLSVLALFLFSFSNRSYAQTNGVGAGIIVGGPTGINAKFWTSKDNAIDLSIGWSISGNWTRLGNNYVYYYSESLLRIDADYIWHSFNAIKSQERFPLYYGAGLQFSGGVSIPSALGLRGVGGIDWMPRGVPLDVFLELAPVFYLSPVTELGFDAGLGARFFFQ